MSLIRVEPLDDELAASVIARAATLNVLAPETILGRKLGAQNCIDAVRDIGLGLEEYCSCFDFSPPAHQSLLLERTLVGYFLSDARSRTDRQGTGRHSRDSSRGAPTT